MAPGPLRHADGTRIGSDPDAALSPAFRLNQRRARLLVGHELSREHFTREAGFTARLTRVAPSGQWIPRNRRLGQ